MQLYEYSHQYAPEKSARAQGYDINASYKDLTQVCHAIKGRPYAAAVKLLEDAESMARPIPYYRHNKGMGHRSQLGGKKGRFPRKEARLMLALLQNAFSNAQAKGLKEESLCVINAQAFKQNVYPRYRRFFVSSHTIGYGKHAVMSNYVTARVELVLGEKGLKPVARKTKKQLKLDAKKKAEKEAAAKKAAEAKAKKAEEKAAKPSGEEKAEKGAAEKSSAAPVGGGGKDGRPVHKPAEHSHSHEGHAPGEHSHSHAKKEDEKK